MSETNPIIVPEGFTLHTENSAHILLPDTNEAFLNPVQEFNRDLSVACIRTWGDVMNEEKKEKWLTRQTKKGENSSKSKKQKIPQRDIVIGPPTMLSASLNAPDNTSADHKDNTDIMAIPTTQAECPPPQKFVILEALSATGLRAIRYAKEIPLVKYVIANDLSPLAIAAIRRNIDINGLPQPKSECDPAESSSSSDMALRMGPAGIKIHEGDACAIMFNHRAPKDRVDVIDLDPYGTASPFIDTAVQSVRDGGLLCVTCTDLAVLATTNYPEKCYANYGGVPIKAEYCHEAALRLVLHTISTSAARYGRYIRPLLSLSIDFYVRLFVRVYTGPLEVKRVVSKTSTYYICTGCQAFYDQPLGRLTEQVHPNGNININVKTASGPKVPERCPECNSVLHVGGPMWSGSIHNKEFISKVLQHLELNTDKYGTSTRMKGMLTVARDELEVPFYFTPDRLAGLFHCVCPPLDDIASALLHAGHSVSRSHACAGSLKTAATRDELHDIFRSWVKAHPVNMNKISKTSPSYQLHQKEAKVDANFKHHPQSVTASSKVKLVRYQQNPTPRWGPGTKASSGLGMKRKRDRDDEDR